MANILHVDDDEMLRTLFGFQFDVKFGQDHHITSVASMAEAMKKLATTKFDLVVADYNLHVKGATGADLADDMKRKLDATPMILLTGDSSMQEEFRKMHSAIKAIVHKPPNIADLKMTMDRVIAESLALEASRITEINETARTDIESLQERISRGDIPEGTHTKRMVELIRGASPEHPDNSAQTSANRGMLADKVADIIEKNPSLRAAIEHFFTRIEKHSPETYAHINNSTQLLAQILATELMPPNNKGAHEYTVDAEKGAALCIAVMLHDYGKLFIPDDILHFPGRLDGAKKTIMKNHVVYSTQMIEALGLPESLKDIGKIIATHHENLDGTGYPKGINKGSREGMPYITHIHPIIDRFKAMTSVRSYRPHPMALEKATGILEDEAKAGMISGKLLERFLPLMWKFREREYIAPVGKANSI